MKKTIVLFLILIGISSSVVAQTNTTETSISNTKTLTQVAIEIDGMACQEGCADKISLNLKNTEGIKEANVNYVNKEAIIRFDPKLVSIENIKSVITNTKVKQYVYTITNIIIKE